MKKSYSGKSARHISSKGNVMTPLNWMVGVSETILISGGIYAKDPLFSERCFWLAVAIVIFYGLMYVYWSVKDPNRLQPEDFNLASQEMSFQVNTSNPGVPIVSSQTQTLINTNPEYTKL